MIASPFGKKFKLRTSLSEAECRRRLEAYLPTSMFDPGFDDVPVAIFKWRRILVWNQHEPNSARLVATMRGDGGATEIVGRSGSNIGLFLIVCAMFVGFVALLVAEPELWRDEWWKAALLLVVPWGAYFLKRDSSHGEDLIEFLKQVLHAESVYERRSDPITR